MDFGAAIFFTDYSMGPVELGRALEERGFGSLWAPEHSHIPLSRRTPFPQGGDLPKKYYDVMDPFLTPAAAAPAPRPRRGGGAARRRAPRAGPSPAGPRGSRTDAAPPMATCSGSCPTSARSPRRRGAIRPPCPSRSSAWRRILT